MNATPPKSVGPLAKREAVLAWKLLSPTLIIVALVVVLPLLAIFWISVKPVGLADLRAPEVRVYERLRGDLLSVGDTGTLQYRVSNSSPKSPITAVSFSDEIPAGLQVTVNDDRCSVSGQIISCQLGELQPAAKEQFKFPVQVIEALAREPDIRAVAPVTKGEASSSLTNSEFTLENFQLIFDAEDFWDVMYATTFYTVVGTVGALVFGMFAALLLNQSFTGQGLFRGFLLFPYVAPVIAVAFTWITLFDPFSGSANALLMQMGMVDAPINFFGERGLALWMVTIFEVWRYFPLSFLFILARMQSIDSEMYEAADIDGASPLQKFWALSIPQLLGILSILFLLRFIWTFNKFDDIFLLTGGNAGTRTLTVNVYEQAFAISNIGAGAAVAVVVFAVLLVFATLFIRFVSKEEGL